MEYYLSIFDGYLEIPLTLSQPTSKFPFGGRASKPRFLSACLRGDAIEDISLLNAAGSPCYSITTAERNNV